MLRLAGLSIFIFTFFISSAFSADAPFATYFDSASFADCILQAIDARGGKGFLEGRLDAAQAFKEDLIKKSSNLKLASDADFLGGMMQIISQLVTYEYSLSSLPLIDFESPQTKELGNKPALTKQLFQLVKAPSDSAPVDRDDLSSVLASQECNSDGVIVDYSIYADPYVKAKLKAAALANPIVLWLLKHPKGSVSHWGLLNYATSVYGGDVLTALAVIGQLFGDEVFNLENRRREAVLASKMIPLNSPATKNPVGDNYHFWQIVTASLIRHSTALGYVYAYFSDDKDKGHLKADYLGLGVTSEVFSKIGKRNAPCQLN